MLPTTDQPDGVTVSTQVVDATLGRPAVEIAVRLERRGRNGWDIMGSGCTDPDGRLAVWGGAVLSTGTYRLIFDSAGYFGLQGSVTFFPEVTVTFVVEDPEGRCHVPLLLSPFACVTYRGAL